MSPPGRLTRRGHTARYLRLPKERGDEGDDDEAEPSQPLERGPSLILLAALVALSLSSACASFAGAGRPAASSAMTAGSPSAARVLADEALRARPASMIVTDAVAGQSRDGVVDVGRRAVTSDDEDLEKLSVVVLGNEARSIAVQVQSWDGGPAVLVTASANDLVERLVEMVSSR